MDIDIIKLLMDKDYKELIEIDGFSPQVAILIVNIRFFNGVYDIDSKLYN